MKNISDSLMEKQDRIEHEVSKNNWTKITVWSKREEHLAYAEISVLGIIFIAATAGNFILIFTLWNRRKKLSRMYVFMLHLSLADLVVAFFQVLPQLIWDITDVFMGPDPLCRTIKYLQLVGMFASTYMIVVMTLDRFQAICYPMVTFQKTRALWNSAICTSWSISLIFSVPQAFIFSKTEIAPGIYECWAQFMEPWGLVAYVTWISITIFFIPVTILSICQIKTCWEIKMNAFVGFPVRDPQIGISRASSVNCISKAMIKNVRMTVVTVVSYVTCWTPFFIAQMWAAWSTDIPDGPVFTIVMLLGNLNSCVNPWIYMYFCGHISHGIKELTRISKYSSNQPAFPVSGSIINCRLRFCEEPVTYV
ncbi:isotocin receptor-like [Bufo gargarizans]|uniref:isotocin receptor-like n=1 Tax=Bufo gargarizans TaxID=30331 RepID=UPI001CF29ED1|nr:isotocin receptor-like [Bufo gargarizans]